MSIRKIFLEKIEKDPENDQIRQIYADYLEEDGDHEEAERQRNWRQSYEWFKDFCEEHSYEYWYDNFKPMDASTLISRAKLGVENGYIQFGAYESLMDAVRSNREEFWKHFQVLTGIYIEDPTAISCSCAC